jgi:hypothetical protein
MTRIVPMTERGTAKAVVDGGLRLARSCGVIDGELILTARKVDAGGALDIGASCALGSAEFGGALAEVVADGLVSSAGWATGTAVDPIVNAAVADELVAAFEGSEDFVSPGALKGTWALSEGLPVESVSAFGIAAGKVNYKPRYILIMRE